VAGSAVLADRPAALAIPKSADPPVDSDFPVAIRRAVATAAEPAAFGELERLAFARPEQFEILRVVTIETMIVAIAPSMSQHEIAVRLGQDDGSVGVEVNDDRLFLVVAGVARHARSVPAGAKELGGGHPDGCGICKLRRRRRDGRPRGQPAPQVEAERRGHAEKANCQARQHERFL